MTIRDAVGKSKVRGEILAPSIVPRVPLTPRAGTPVGPLPEGEGNGICGQESLLYGFTFHAAALSSRAPLDGCSVSDAGSLGAEPGSMLPISALVGLACVSGEGGTTMPLVSPGMIGFLFTSRSGLATRSLVNVRSGIPDASSRAMILSAHSLAIVPRSISSTSSQSAMYARAAMQEGSK